MQTAPVSAPSVVELAIMGLQQERCACVSRLTALLGDAGRERETQGYMRRIENINEALIRLSRAEVTIN